MFLHWKKLRCGFYMLRVDIREKCGYCVTIWNVSSLHSTRKQYCHRAAWNTLQSLSCNISQVLVPQPSWCRSVSSESRSPPLLLRGRVSVVLPGRSQRWRRSAVQRSPPGGGQTVADGGRSCHAQNKRCCYKVELREEDLNGWIYFITLEMFLTNSRWWREHVNFESRPRGPEHVRSLESRYCGDGD